MRYYDVLRSWLYLIVRIICDMFGQKPVVRGTIDRVFRPAVSRLIREAAEFTAGAEKVFTLVAIRSPPKFQESSVSLWILRPKGCMS